MKKLLRARDVLLLGLSGTLDLFEELKDPLQIVSKSYENMYGWIPKKYKRHHFQHLVWRNLKTGYIEKVEKNGEMYIRLTSKGKEKIARDFPLLVMQRKRWDKKWRVAIFDIQETNKRTRDILRKKLKELGFGMLQKSVFISPHDIATDFAEFVEEMGLMESVYIFEASNPELQNPKELANKVWNAEDLNDKYRRLVKRIKSIENQYLKNPRDRVDKLNDRFMERITEALKKLKEEYLAITLQDPFLPEELLPSDWMREKAKRLTIKLTKLYG